MNDIRWYSAYHGHIPQPYALFIDDERMPPDDGRHWCIVRSYEEALAALFMHGWPSYISFDHDLGRDLTGKDIASAIAYRLINDGATTLPFEYYVHSQNPIGAKAIHDALADVREYEGDV